MFCSLIALSVPLSLSIKLLRAFVQVTPATPIPVRLTAFTNRTFTFVTRSPPATW